MPKMIVVLELNSETRWLHLSFVVALLINKSNKRPLQKGINKFYRKNQSEFQVIFKGFRDVKNYFCSLRFEWRPNSETIGLFYLLFQFNSESLLAIVFASSIDCLFFSNFALFCAFQLFNLLVPN